MSSTDFKQHKIRLYLACLIAVLFISNISACTVKRDYFSPGIIPDLAVPSPEAEEYGNLLFHELRDDYVIDSESKQYKKLVDIFNQLTIAAEVDHIPWNIYLLDDQDIADIRAVHGNYIFVWSGTMNAVENDDELAGLLACELSHVLARHTDPVQFTLASDLLFSVGDLAASVGLMLASQGVVSISGNGWMKWAYVEIADLDPMDRKYSEDYELEAADIALSVISQTRYSPQDLLNFWKRVAVDESLSEQYERFSRRMAPQKRVAMIENLMVNQPKEDKQLAKMPTQ